MAKVAPVLPAIAASPGFAASLPAIATASTVSLAPAAVGTGLSLGTLANIASVGGSVISAIGAASQGDVGARQAGILRQQAERERQIGKEESEDFRRRQRALLAKRRALLGAGGVDAGSGSPLLVSDDFAREIELQARRIEAGGDLRATRLEQQSALTRASGRAARTGGFLRGGARILTGIGETFG